LVREQLRDDWPDDYLSSVIGCYADDPLEQPADELPDEPEAETTRTSLERRA